MAHGCIKTYSSIAVKLFHHNVLDAAVFLSEHVGMCGCGWELHSNLGIPGPAAVGAKNTQRKAATNVRPKFAPAKNKKPARYLHPAKQRKLWLRPWQVDWKKVSDSS